MQKFEFIREDYRFSCELHFARRKTLVLRVKPDLSLSIKAPLYADFKWIEGFIFKKADWISAQQKILREKHQALKQAFSHGSTCYYLGKAYILHTYSAEKGSVKMGENSIVLECPDHHSRGPLLKSWYQAAAHQFFSERLKQCYQSVSHLNLPAPKTLRIKALKSRWGSCDSNQKISLNLDLIQYPIECIDYVIFHELCHLREMNHGTQFYALMDQAMANWQTHRRTLRKLHKSMPSLLI